MRDVPLWSWAVGFLCELALVALSWRYVLKPAIRQIVIDVLHERGVPQQELPRCGVTDAAVISAAPRPVPLGGLHG